MDDDDDNDDDDLNLSHRCTGPLEDVVEGGCDSCEIGLRRKAEDQTISCLPPDTDSCEPGYHMTAVATTSASPMAGRKVTTRRPSVVTGCPRALPCRAMTMLDDED